MRRHFLLTVLALAICTNTFGEPGKVHKKRRPIKDSYLVMLDPQHRDLDGVAHDLGRRYGGKVTAVWTDAVHGFAMRMNAQQAAALSRDSRVLVVEEDETAEVVGWCYTSCYPEQTFSGCADGTVPWQLDRIDKRAHNELDGKFEHCANPGYYTRAYVIDSGIRMHPDFLDGSGFKRVAHGQTYINDGRGTDDCLSHGTHVASFLAGRDSGAAKDATLVPIRVLDCEGRGSAENVINGIRWAITDHQSGPAVLNISLNFSYSAIMNAAVDSAVADGILVVVAAGNTNGSNNCASSPASASSALVVGASDKFDRVASFSATGPCVDLFAPGDKVGGAHWNGGGAYNCNPGWNGTSMAAPVAAGVAAVLYDALYEDNTHYYRPDQLMQIMIDSSAKNVLSGVPSGTPNRLLQSELGWGKCQPYLCLEWCDPNS